MEREPFSPRPMMEKKRDWKNVIYNAIYCSEITQMAAELLSDLSRNENRGVKQDAMEENSQKGHGQAFTVTWVSTLGDIPEEWT